jgi:hypothetical protein
MQTKMDIYVTIRPRKSNYELRRRLAFPEVNITEAADEIRVCARIDIRENTIEKILEVCNEYGDCSVYAHMVEEKEPL